MGCGTVGGKGSGLEEVAGEKGLKGRGAPAVCVVPDGSRSRAGGRWVARSTAGSPLGLSASGPPLLLLGAPGEA